MNAPQVLGKLTKHKHLTFQPSTLIIMATSDAFLAHVVSRMQADIDFLVGQGVISSTDGQLMTSKLPFAQPAAAMPTPMASPSPTPTLVVPSPRRVAPPAPAPPYSQAAQARSLWPYNETGQEPGDLSFMAGETIEILEETNADWWKGKNSRGQTGLFPSNYVEKVAPTSTGPPCSLAVAWLHPFPARKLPIIPCLWHLCRPSTCATSRASASSSSEKEVRRKIGKHRT
ncbi:SH3 domain-containing protein [Gautieria morchelliformis]|nr:SH3 domain-containing protein [Gautieria morchelliformis]